MADDKLSGNDMLLFIDVADGTTYADLVICLTSNGFKISNSIIDAKSKCGADNLPGAQTFEVPFEGQVILRPGTNKLGIYDLLILAKNKTRIGWKIAKAGTAATGDLIITGSAFIADVDIKGAVDDPATFSASLGIYGTPTITEAA